LALCPAWLIFISATKGQDADDSISPPPAVSLPPPNLGAPTLDSPSGSSRPANEAETSTSSSQSVIKLPPFEVTAPRDQTPSLKQTYEKANHAFDGPFPSLRSGSLIEAILWRHRYLTEHTDEEAVIVTTQKGEKIRSATTVYTKDGKVYGSSNALGEKLPIPGLVPADLHLPSGIARARNYIIAVRGGHGSSASGTDLSTLLPPSGALLVTAEDSGDYSMLAQAAGAPERAPTIHGVPIPGAQDAYDTANRALRVAMVQAFAEPSTEILSWTYDAMHNSARAGIVPVALAQVHVEGSIAMISPFAANLNDAIALRSNQLPSKNIISEKKHVTQYLTAIVFDWDGVQYLYQPDVGTQGKPLPLNPVTGLPYLCVKGGALMECAYFCATYAKQHPDEKAVLLPGDPILAAYQSDGKLGLFIPSLGRFTLSKDFADAIDDAASLAQLRDQLVALQQQQRGARPDVIPDQILGDDTDMQMRRAFLAFQSAGIPCQLNEDAGPSLSFTLEGAPYVYGPDQQVHAAPGG
jgi:hypothetical protein